MDETFKEVGLENLWVECPECESPALLEMGDCPFCTTSLVEMGGEESEEEEVEESEDEESEDEESEEPDEDEGEGDIEDEDD
jgi:endogenous inhibitor of DNA gyrase (YacG/DUF329 family)